MENATPKGWRAVNFPAKATGTSHRGEIGHQTGHHKFHPATMRYGTTDRWLPEGFLVLFQFNVQFSLPLIPSRESPGKTNFK